MSAVGSPAMSGASRWLAARLAPAAESPIEARIVATTRFRLRMKVLLGSKLLQGVQGQEASAVSPRAPRVPRTRISGRRLWGVTRETGLRHSVLRSRLTEIRRYRIRGCGPAERPVRGE